MVAKTKGYLNEYKLSQGERVIITSAINKCGSGLHPEPNEDSFGFFTASYAIDCLKKAITHKSLKKDAIPTFNVILEKLQGK